MYNMKIIGLLLLIQAIGLHHAYAENETVSENNTLETSEMSTNWYEMTTNLMDVTENGTDSYGVLRDQELMEYLFDIGFNSDVFQETCNQKLTDHGYYDRLTIYHRFCLCLLFCMPGFADHELTEAEQEKLAIEEEIAEKAPRNPFQGITRALAAGSVASYSFIILVGAIGNILVLVTVSKFMRKPSVTYIFICSISCSDLLVCLICAPMKLYRRVRLVSENLQMCQIMNHLYFMSLACSVYSLLAMSMERYFVICHPMKAQSVSTTTRAKKIVLGVWLCGAITAIPFTYFTGSGASCAVQVSRYGRTGARVFIFCTAAALYIIPLILMVFAYSSVSVTLWKSIKVSKSMQNKRDQSNGTDGKKNSEESGRIAVIKMLILVLVMFILCWSLYWWILMLRYSLPSTNLSLYELTAIEAAANILAYFNSAVNPILYAFSSRPMRNGFRDCFRVCCGKSSRDLLKETTSKTGSTGISSSISNPSVSA